MKANSKEKYLEKQRRKQEQQERKAAKEKQAAERMLVKQPEVCEAVKNRPKMSIETLGIILFGRPMRTPPKLSLTKRKKVDQALSLAREGHIQEAIEMLGKIGLKLEGK